MQTSRVWKNQAISVSSFDTSAEVNGIVIRIPLLFPALTHACPALTKSDVTNDKSGQDDGEGRSCALHRLGETDFDELEGYKTKEDGGEPERDEENVTTCRNTSGLVKKMFSPLSSVTCIIKLLR